MTKVYVFAYGSLLARFYDQEARSLQPANLCGYQRLWNVAMDNSLDISGYRYFIDPATNQRPDIYVTFLNISPDTGSETNGLLVPVSNSDLGLIDQRERNYSRIDVTTNINLKHLHETITVYTYIGKPEARLRFETGEQQNKAFIASRYMEKVIDGFKTLGDRHIDQFYKTTLKPSVSVRNLIEIKIP